MLNEDDDRYTNLSNEIHYSEDDMIERVFHRMERLGFTEDDGLEALDQLTSPFGVDWAYEWRVWCDNN